MKNFLLTCVSTLFLLPLQAQFSVSYQAGKKDSNWNFMGGTEMRVLAAHKGKLYGGIETWMDTIPTNGQDPYIGAQILRLDAPNGNWQLDRHFNEPRNNPQPGQRTLFRNEGVTALESIIFKTDSLGNPLPKPDTILIAACRDFNGIASVYTRNDLTGIWTETVVAPTAGTLKATIRSLVSYRDKVTGVDLVFAGCLPQGMVAGVYAPQLPGKISWRVPEISASNTNVGVAGSGSFQGRPMAFAECNGQLHIAAAPVVLRRQDGPNPKWIEVFRYALNVTPGGSSGLRGLTCIPNPNGNGQSLLAALEGNQGAMIRLDPKPTLPYSSTIELNIMQNLTDAWKTIPPAINASYVVVANSEMTWVKDPITQDSTLFITIQHHPAKARDDAFYYIRRVKNGAITYDLKRIDNTKLNPLLILNSTRACIISPFTNDNQYLYFGGYDADDNPNHNSAYALRADINTAFGYVSTLEIKSYKILPSTTDPKINTYTSSTMNQYHTAFYPKGISLRNQLFVFLPGSGGIPLGYDSICITATNLGYHTIGLMYPNEPAVGALCQNNADSLCFEKVRREIIDGTDRTTQINVNTDNAIENRLIQLLKYLQTQNPSENWIQYLDSNNKIRWDKIVISGHSQGGGHAGIIAQQNRVARVVFFAAPKDYNNFYNRNGAWIYKPNLTPPEAYFGISHSEDDTGCTPAQQFQAFNLLGMNRFGAPAYIERTSAPYNNTHTFTSAAACPNPHGCVAVDNVQQVVPAYLKNAWIYMLTAPISAITKVKDAAVSEKSVQIFPNPAKDYINILIRDENPQALNLRLFNSSGQLAGVYQMNSNDFQIDINNLPSGLYLLQLQSENSIKSYKILKQ